MQQSLDSPEEFFKCLPSWPLCVYDFTYKSIIPEYFVYKTSTITVLEDYFSDEECTPGSGCKPRRFDNVVSEKEVHEGLLVERNVHFC